MARLHLFEFEDQAWFPSGIRDAMTGFLRAAGRVAGHGGALAEVLEPVMRETGETRIVDLCSGGGGPIPDAITALRESGIEATATLTDLHPSPQHAARLAAESPHVRFELDSIDATQVPEKLEGVRTIVNGLHHLRPPLARSLLADAVRDGAPVVAAEFVGRHPLLLAAILFAPINVLFTMPLVRPFRWYWVPLTYVVPLIPLLALWDGLVSCLRVYSERELLDLVDGLDQEAGEGRYEFRIARMRVAPGLPLRMPALVGVPLQEADGASTS